MAKLTVVEGPDTGAEFPLPEEAGASVVIGRDPRNGVPLGDGSVSREHLRIERVPRGYRLLDLGSKNRTFLNGEPVREAVLRSGDRIGVGDTEVRFEEDRPVVEEEGLESTIMKEIPASGGEALSGIVEAVSSGAAGREERLGRALERVRQILGISQALGRSRTLEELYEELLEVLLTALEADRVAVLAPAGGRWEARAVRQAGGAPGGESPSAGVSQSILRRAAEEGKAVLTANARADERFRAEESIIKGGISSAIAAPILGPPPAVEGAARGPRAGAVPRRAVAAVLYADRRRAGRPFRDEELGLVAAAAAQTGDVLARLEEQSRLRDENRNLLRSISDSKRIIGRSRAMAEVHEFIRRAAPAHQTVLIRGETGTGKELVAAAIHYGGARQGKPFIAINCAAIPDTLIESELFGHERGAFTGAVSRRKGRFELAHTGTVFLDEVAELSPGCQAKLLRLLEDRRLERLGGSQPIEVDVRIIAATNRDLAREIQAGRFREDLFYRLNVLGVTLPSLRERREDIPLLAAHFLAEAGEARRTISAEAAEKLSAYDWPGNVRQLRNVIESAVVLGRGPEIRPADLVLPRRADDAGASGAWEPLTLEELQRRHILKVLEHTGGNKKRAADILGIERCTLYAKLKGMAAPASAEKPPREAGEDIGKG